MTDAIPTRDWNRLSPEARAFLALLASLREGRTISELADRLGTVVDGVVDHITVSDSGKVMGPKGTLTLTLTVAPNEVDVQGNSVVVRDEVKSRHPEDRSHVVYVGKGSTLHARQDTVRSLFEAKGDGTTG